MKRKKFLDKIEVKSPCNESWDEMTGNDEVRFCSHCAKDVHNISAMNRTDAEKLVKKSNGKLCVRYVKTMEGNLITAPPKFTQITRRATIAAGILATTLSLSTLAYAQGEPIARKDNSAQTNKDTTQKDEAKQGFATISGTVKDVAQGVVPGAKITLRDTKTNKIRQTQTNDVGSYEFKGVEPSVYELTVERDGFKKLITQDIKVLKDLMLRQNLVLEVGEATIGVVDIAKEPPIEIQTEKLSEKPIEQRQIQELPINGRKFVTMGLFPGIYNDEKSKTKQPKKKKN